MKNGLSMQIRSVLRTDRMSKALTVLTLSEFLGKAPAGEISGMISEVKRPFGEKPNQMRFKAADAWGLK